MSYDRKLMGDRVKQVRSRLGTQKQFAEDMGISAGHLRELEAGRGGAPSSELLFRIAVAGGVSVDWLMGGSPPLALHTDGELLGRVSELVADVYRAEGVVLSQLELGRIVAREYDGARGASLEQWVSTLRASAEQRLRHELRTESMGRRAASE